MTDGEYIEYEIDYIRKISIQQLEDHFWNITAEYIEHQHVVIDTKCEIIKNHMLSVFQDNRLIEIIQDIEPV